MAREILWIHDKALNSFLVQAINDKARAIFVWDDEYFKTRSYSLKRLVFIYETLCQMSVDIIKGDTIEIMRSLSPTKITTLYVADTKIKEIIQLLTKNFDVDIVKSQPFVKVPDGYEFRRFFKYWAKAKKTAFLRNGGVTP